MNVDAGRAHAILFVCLGNICRSPTAEGVFKHLLAQEDIPVSVVVDSAGTSDYHVGRAPDPRSRRAALRRGIDLSALRARQVETRDFERFDLLVAMDLSNLHDLEALRPAGSRAQLRRFMEFAPELGRLDVPDPYGGGEDGFEDVLDLTTAASRGLIGWLRKQA
jgi:protein-tyrosine phosphatase